MPIASDVKIIASFPSPENLWLASATTRPENRQTLLTSKGERLWRLFTVTTMHSNPQNPRFPANLLDGLYIAMVVASIAGLTYILLNR